LKDDPDFVNTKELSTPVKTRDLRPYQSDAADVTSELAVQNRLMKKVRAEIHGVLAFPNSRRSLSQAAIITATFSTGPFVS
jgi:hypothetical protein